MSNKMNRVFGLTSITAKNSIWNADFSGYPKEVQGNFFGSDRALKFAIKQFMDQSGESIFMKKRYGQDFEILNKERLETMFKNIYSIDLKNKQEMIKAFDDFKQFGMLYDNTSFQGAVQFTQGFDRYQKGEIYEDELIGPMRFKDESKNSTSGEKGGMGSKMYLSEAHYFYDFSVNPTNYDVLNNVPYLEDYAYTRDDYNKLVDGILYGPANLKTTQKLNCFTSFSLFVELSEGSKIYLNNLKEKVQVYEKDGEITYDLTELLKHLDGKIEKHGIDQFNSIDIIKEMGSVNLEGIDMDQYKFLNEILTIKEI